MQRSAKQRLSTSRASSKPRTTSSSSDLHKKPLATYREKRRFEVTAEPKGARPKRRTQGLSYVVQKHRATALHYDFRLEWNGVMLSWAVPKGPSLDPSDKRLAMAVEDHPLEYNAFEGIIPEGEYGGGTVMIWDRGAWTPTENDVDAALRRGDLKFHLDGEKLKGSWVLVRIRRRGQEGKVPWLLIKHRDEYAGKRPITEEEPRSVVSGRLLVEIARDRSPTPTRCSGPLRATRSSMWCASMPTSSIASSLTWKIAFSRWSAVRTA